MQEIEIPTPEKPRFLNASGVGRKDVLRLFFRFKIRQKPVLTVQKINQILLKVAVFLAVSRRERADKTVGKIPQVKLSLVVMVEISPVLLDMYLVGIERVESYARVVIFLNKALKERSCLRTEVVHFRRFVRDDDHNAVASAQICAVLCLISFSRNGRANERTAALRRNDLERTVEFDDLVFVNCVKRFARELSAFRKSKDPNVLTLDLNRAFIIRPAFVFPERDGKLPGCGIAVSFPYGIVR